MHNLHNLKNNIMHNLIYTLEQTNIMYNLIWLNWMNNKKKKLMISFQWMYYLIYTI